jgi:hypothetical protein
MRNPLKQASETMEELQVASRSVVATSEFAAVALLAVAGLSLAALLIALVALERATFE